MCQCYYKPSQIPLQIHVTDGIADGSNWVLQVAATSRRPAPNTDYSRQALERALMIADVQSELSVQASSVIQGLRDLVEAKLINSCQGQKKIKK